MAISIAIIQGLVMVPIYLQFIPVNIYSFWLATGNILAWMSATDPGLTVVLQQQIADSYGKKDLTKVRNVIGGGLLFSAIVFVVAIIFGLIAAEYLPDVLNIVSKPDNELILAAFTLAVLGTALMIFSFGLAAINAGLQGSIAVGVINNSVAIGSILVTYYLLHSGFGLMALPLSLVFSGVCYSLFQGIYLFVRVYKERIGVTFSFLGMKDLGKLLSYTFLSRTLTTVANNIDLVVVAKILGPGSVAILALTRKSCDLTKELINQPTAAFQPAVSHALGAGDIKQLSEVLSRLVHILTWLLFLVVGGIISFNEAFVHLWVGAEFFAGSTVNLAISIALAVTVICSCLGQLCLSLGDVKGTSLVAGLQALLFIPLVIIGTEYFGILGAVCGSIGSTLLVSVWYFPRKFKKLLKLSAQTVKSMAEQIFLSMMTVSLMTYIFSFFSYSNWLEFAFFSGTYSIVYAAFLFSLSVSFRRETSLIWDFLSSLRNKRDA